MIFSINIDYKTNKTELCEIGRKYDTDKSSQRDNVTNSRHCHPYTLFYHSLFKNKKDDKLNIAELGVLEGSSLLMWREYFKNSTIYGFDNNIKFINNFKEKYDTSNIILNILDVKNKNNISNVFENINEQYDIIIEDTTHQFNDQLNVIESVYKYLKPGGILIIEDIFKSYNENDYINKLKQANILQNFQDTYFVSLDHKNRNSTGWNNDKLFILVKNGGKPIFSPLNKITIITPSYRTNNLIKLKNSINFDYVNEWIIVYDGSKITTNPYLFKNDNNSEKIKELIHNGEGISGNPQRNYALDNIDIEDTFLYYLDDDNIIHPHLYKLLNIIEKEKIYTFDQSNRLKGNNINIRKIDTAMMLIDYRLCKNNRWIKDLYCADGYYIKECYDNNIDKHIYVNNDLCYYNKIF
jgi:predicted O-methyltransferase YrrM